MTTAGEEEGHTYLIIFGAPGQKRKVIHIAHERNGEQVPRCNSHYLSSQDQRPRRFRQAEGDERNYPVCKRCQKWRAWQW